jgi:2-oxo-3-hexenedioate decarboxylase
MTSKEIASELWTAQLERRDLFRFTARQSLDMAQGYQIQDELRRLQLASGDTLVGYKMGLTSKAKMKQMKVESPIWGYLTQSMLLQSGTSFDVTSCIHPKIEPEIAFRTSKDISGALSAKELQHYVDGVCPALEIIDSRYKDFQFELPDVVADNCSAHHFVIGLWQRMCDLDNLGMVMECDDVLIQAGSSSAILGHPLESLAELTKMLAARGEAIPAHSVILAGAATAAVTLDARHNFCLRVQNLGELTLLTK